MRATQSFINPLKARLAEDKPAIGMLVSMPSVATTQILAAAGFDWLFFDMEHGSIDIASVHAMVTVTQGTRATPIVRVPWNLHWLVKPVLDAGAMGMVFPMIHNRAEAEAAARSVRYPPRGNRGYGPFYGPARFGITREAYVDAADDQILCMLLIEHREAIDNIREIVNVPGVDACQIAPNDLAMSYGYRDGPDHPEVQDAIGRAEEVILAGPTYLGGLALDNATANRMIGRGYRIILTGSDTLLLERGSAEILGGIDRGD